MINRKQPKNGPVIYRQGDVLLVRVDKPAGQMQKQDPGRLILQHGEATGHAHAIPAERVDETNLYIDGARRYLEICFSQPSAEPVPLVHEEHDTVSLPEGVYEVRIQREWDVLEQIQRQVID